MQSEITSRLIEADHLQVQVHIALPNFQVDGNRGASAAVAAEMVVEFGRQTLRGSSDHHPHIDKGGVICPAPGSPWSTDMGRRELCCSSASTRLFLRSRQPSAERSASWSGGSINGRTGFAWAPFFTATCETTVQFGDTRAVALLRVTKRVSRDSRSLMIFAGSCSQITNENVFPRLHQRSPPIAASALHIHLLLGSGSTGDRMVST